MGYAEGNVERYLREEIKRRGGICYKLPPSGINGVPDRVIIYNGRTLFIETKAPNGHLRKNQQLRINEIRNCGGFAEVCYTRKQINDLLHDLRYNQYIPSLMNDFRGYNA